MAPRNGLIAIRLVRLVAFGLLILLAVASVHELIPSLCPVREGIDNACPFCTLLYTVVLVLAGIVCAVRVYLVSILRCRFSWRRPSRPSRAAYGRRAPPKSAII